MRYFTRNYLGVDISSSSLQAVKLVRAGKGAQLSAARSRDLPAGLIAPQQRELNITRPDDVVPMLRELLDPLGDNEERISLSLPDGSGRLLIHEMETMFKTRAEGLEILRWQLKHSLPAPPQEVQLDYQILNRNDNGRHRVLVSVLAKKVLEQYEKLFNAAGYQPHIVDFHSLSVLNFYQAQIEFSDDLILLVVDGSTLIFQYFQNGQLVLHRYREVGHSVEKVFQEVNRTVAGNREKLPSIARAKAYLQSDWDTLEPLLVATESALEKPLQLLDPKIKRLTADRSGMTLHQERCLAAAVGAAGRLM
jgi:type IV pilus assembly protein PilM